MPRYAKDESKENNDVGWIRSALGWNCCMGMVDRGRTGTCAAEECERARIYASANP